MTAMMAYNCISRWSGALGVCAIVAIIRPAHADPRAVVELFTSQGCSSCPPADKIIGELAKDPSVIALSMPIDYWDYLGWKDTLADTRFSARQKAYSQVRGDRDVYTPQVIVNGSAHVIGSDRASIEGAITDTSKADGVMSVPVTMTLSGKQINVSVAAEQGAVGGGTRRSLDLLGLEGGADLDRARRESRPGGHLPQCGAQSAEGRRLERQFGKLDRAAGKYFPRGRRCRGGLCPGRQSRKARRRCSARPTPRCTNLALSPCSPDAQSGSRDARKPSRITLRWIRATISKVSNAGVAAIGDRAASARTASHKRKRTNFRWPSIGINSLCEQARSRRPRGAGG